MAILRIEPNIVDSGGNFTFGNATVTANVSAGNVLSAGYFWANGDPFVSSSYSNVDVAAYLTVDSTIAAINANVSGANAAIVTANTALKNYTDYQITTANSAVTSYVNTLNTAMAANVAGANAAIITANTAMKSYVDAQDSAVTSAWTANAASQESAISDLRANIIAANAAILATTINLAGTSGTGSVANGGTLTFAGTYGVTAAASSSTITIATPQDLRTTASPSFNALTLGNLTVGNLTIQGNTTTVASQDLSITDSIINLHTFANLAPLTTDDGRDIGLAMHYYKGADGVAFVGWANDSGYLEYYAAGTESANTFTGTAYGTIKAGEFLSVNNTPSTSTTTGAIRVTGGIGAQGNIFAGSVYTDNHNYANGVAILSGVYSSLTAANLSIAGANAAIITANTALKNYTDYQITTANTAVVSYVDALNTAMASNVAGANAAIITANTALKNYTDNQITTANSAVVSYVNTLNTAMASNVVGANAAIITANSAMKSYVDAQDSAITSAWTANAGVQADAIALKAPIASPTFTGTVTTPALSVNGNTSTGNILAGGYFWANGTPFASSNYGNTNVEAYLPISSTIITINSNIAGANAAIVTANTGMKSYVDAQFTAAGGYGNTQVGAYLTVYSGNISAGNITATGNIVGGGVRATTSASAPSNPTVGDIWYSTTDSTTLRYTYDGSSRFWLDIGGSTSSANAIPLGSTIDSYLPTSSIIVGINANVAGANAAIVAANSAVTSYVNTLNSAMASNVAGANAAVVTANTALKSYVDAQNTTITTAWTANAGVQADAIALKAPIAGPTFTGTVTAPIISVTGNATIAGNIVQQQAYYETYGNISNTGGNLTCNFNLGSVFYVTSLTANVTASFTNVNALTSTVTATTLIIDQGATAYKISNIQINGVAQTIRWIGTTAHTGTASNTDIVSFSLIHLGSGTYRVLGQSSSYG